LRGLPLVGPEEWVQTREGKSLLDKNDLLMEDAETQSDPNLVSGGFGTIGNSAW